MKDLRSNVPELETVLFAIGGFHAAVLILDCPEAHLSNVHHRQQVGVREDACLKMYPHVVIMSSWKQLINKKKHENVYIIAFESGHQYTLKIL